MKERLKKFNRITRSLLPHETKFLIGRNRSKDKEKKSILEIIDANAKLNKDFIPFDLDIDKRKYSSLLSWIQTELDKVDIDRKLTWISKMHTDILLDRITPQDEFSIIQSLDRCLPTAYYFRKYYTMLLEYRHFLLIRLRYGDHSKVDNYLDRYKYDFQKSTLTYDQIHQATTDIIASYRKDNSQGIQWKNWLMECFSDDKLDGQTRYMAFIRLSFICLQYDMLGELEALLNHSESFFKNGNNYSRRLLLNYYDNMLVLHDRKKEYEKAEYYGYLSIRADSPDKIIYVNNLVNVLYKLGKYQAGLSIIESVQFSIRSTKNFHSAIGFVANNIRGLSKTERNREAVTKGGVFLNAYSKQILRYRWHRFFAAYLGALLIAAKYREIIRVVDKYNLVNKELNSNMSQDKIMIVSIYYYLAAFRRHSITQQEFEHKMDEFMWSNARNRGKLDTELIEMVGSLCNIDAHQGP